MKLKIVGLGLCTSLLLTGCSSTTLSNALHHSTSIAASVLGGITSADLNKKGREIFVEEVNKASAAGKLDTRSTTYKRINATFQRLLPYADQLNRTSESFDWQLAVIKSDEVNAMVLPGGKVMFYTGIVEKLKLTDDEIAAIMGHEMIHALEEHAKNEQGANALTGLVLGLGSQAMRLGETGQQIAGLGSQVGLSLPYSRHLESRADEGGLMLMARAGYNPNAAVTLWEKMSAYSGKEIKLLSFLSTHPSDSKRINAMREDLPKALEIYKSTKR